MNKPKVGTVLWPVHENYYDRPRPSAGVFREYVIRKATVSGYCKGGYTEICTLEGPCSELDKKGKTPCYYKLSWLDKEWIFHSWRLSN